MLRETFALLMIVCFAGGQTDSVIDIVNVVARNRVNEPSVVSASVGKAGGDPGTSQQQSSLTIEMVSATLSDDTGAHSLVFQVRLRNTGNESVAIPVDPSLADVEPAVAGTPYSYVAAHISIVLPETNRILQGVSLYGSKEATGSLKELRVGQSIEIRARTPLRPVNPDANLVVPTHLSVKGGFFMQRAQVSLRRGTLEEDLRQIAPEVVSSNIVTLSAGS